MWLTDFIWPLCKTCNNTSNVFHTKLGWFCSVECFNVYVIQYRKRLERWMQKRKR